VHRISGNMAGLIMGLLRLPNGGPRTDRRLRACSLYRSIPLYLCLRTIRGLQLRAHFTVPKVYHLACTHSPCSAKVSRYSDPGILYRCNAMKTKLELCHGERSYFAVSDSACEFVLYSVSLSYVNYWRSRIRTIPTETTRRP
jgi:hypothetical protein